MNCPETCGIRHTEAVAPLGAPQASATVALEAEVPAPPSETAPCQRSHTAQALSRVEAVMAGLGGEMIVHPDENGLVKFSVHFQSSPALVERIEALLCSRDPGDDNGNRREAHGQPADPEIDRVLQTTKQFMQAFCEGDLERCREVLHRIADQQSHRELFAEIGQLAREFHTSLSELTETLDPAFRVIVEEKLPDSGSRLEHILEITENAANVTLDKVEVLQGRNEEDIDQIKRLGEILEALSAIGPQAEARLNDAIAIAERLSSSARQSREDLVSILMAQDFQDLTGQIIQRVLGLLKDLEAKLVHVVRVFGAKGERVETADREVLYGPAHKGKVEALHSQDDVDSLLADFGF